MSAAVSRFYPSLSDVEQQHQIHLVNAHPDGVLGAWRLDVTCTCRHMVSVPAGAGTVDVADALDRHVHGEWVKASTIDEASDLNDLPEASVIDDHGTIGVRTGAVWRYVGTSTPYEPTLPVTLVRFGDGSHNA
jgi:hypothetical protein